MNCTALAVPKPIERQKLNFKRKSDKEKENGSKCLFNR
jgi:hypothetical protein